MNESRIIFNDMFSLILVYFSLLNSQNDLVLYSDMETSPSSGEIQMPRPRVLKLM